MPNSCYVCHSRKNLNPCHLEWEMFDGTPAEVHTYRCDACNKELDEIMNWKMPESWVSDTMKKLQSAGKMAPMVLVPIWFYFKGGVL